MKNRVFLKANPKKRILTIALKKTDQKKNRSTFISKEDRLEKTQR